MHLTAYVAAGGGFGIGLAIGLCIGFLVGPAVRSWLALREWADASREARLADQLLARMEREAEPDPSAEPTTPADPRSR